MTMSAPASIAARPSVCWLLDGVASYSVPQCGKTMTTSAPASRAFLTSSRTALAVMIALPTRLVPAAYDFAIVS